MFDAKSVAALRMKRLCLPNAADKGAYDRLFRDLSPVPPEGWCEPGTPPTLSNHAGFDDEAYNHRRRAGRDILKGRFAGAVGYVAKEDLELFACIYRKPPKQPDFIRDKLLELLRREGPMNIGLIKEFSGLLVKEITPALHKLQEAFLVYEDQADNAGDRCWCVFAEEFPEARLDRYTREEALAAVLPRFARRAVFFDCDMLRSFYKLPAKDLRAALGRLTQAGAFVPADLDGKAGYLSAEDFALLNAGGIAPPEPLVLLLQRTDFWPKANEKELKERFPAKNGWEALGYLLIDGELRGAVQGRFKFGPHLVEDIVLDLPPEQARARKAEILAAVAGWFDPAVSPARRYCGVPLEAGKRD